MPDHITLYLPIRFPVDQINCNHCFLCQQDPHNRNRLVCLAWPQTITNPASMGWMCPLKWGKEDNKDGKPHHV